MVPNRQSSHASDELALAAASFNPGTVTIVTGEAFDKILTPLAREFFDVDAKVADAPQDLGRYE